MGRISWRLDEDLSHLAGSLLAKSHRLRQIGRAELDHDRVRVTVDDLGIVLVAVGDGVRLFHLGLGLLDHVATIRSHGRRNSDAWQLADYRTREAVH